MEPQAAKDMMGEHYPADWSEFIGQDQVKRQLRIAAKSSSMRKVPMGHTLLSSPIPGVGKTSLAMLTALELGSNVVIQSGPIKNDQVPFLLMDMQDGDVLFLDEAHRLVQGGKGGAEWLLHLMENNVIMTRLGPEEAPKITVIAATTDAGRLPRPILDRFEITPTIEQYGDADGEKITMQLSRKILEAASLTLPTAEVAARVARAGNNSPRQIRNVLCKLRDLVWAGEATDAQGNYELDEAFVMAGVTPDGLTSQAQKYLSLMVTDFRGDPAGQKVMADRLGEVGTGMVEVERALLDKGLIALTKAGRVLTNDGMRRAKQLVAA